MKKIILLSLIYQAMDKLLLLPKVEEVEEETPPSNQIEIAFQKLLKMAFLAKQKD